MGSNMLSVKKVKLHGMQDSRWTVHDHKTQYRGLVRLFERDRKIIDGELKMSIKKNKKELKHLLKDISAKRQQLDNWTNGDRHAINNLLSIDKNLKLAYKNLSVPEILDHLFQNNFSKRKTMDLLKYKLRIKIERLIKLRLEEGDLVNQIEFTVQNKTPLEMQIGVITGKVQGMILKKEAAITVNATYKVLLDLLQKDAIYYNAVLDALSKDNYSQGQCLLEAITLGQLATEHLDDMHAEFEHLQAVVRADRKVRIADIEDVEKRLNETVRNLRTLVRKDSDLNVGFVTDIIFTTSYQQFASHIELMEVDMRTLQNEMMVSNFDEIFPRLKEQARQSRRLMDFLQKGLQNLDVLSKRKQHAELMVETVENSNYLQQSEYETKRNTLLEQIKETKGLFENTLDQKNRFGSKLAQLRASLQNIESLCKMIRAPDESKHEESQFDVLKEDSNDMMKYILHKITSIVSGRAAESLGINVGQLVLTPKKYLKFAETIKKTSIDLTKTWRSEEPDDTEVIMDDSSVPTRADIKEASRVIYENYVSSQFD